MKHIYIIAIVLITACGLESNQQDTTNNNLPLDSLDLLKDIQIDTSLIINDTLHYSIMDITKGHTIKDVILYNVRSNIVYFNRFEGNGQRWKRTKIGRHYCGEFYIEYSYQNDDMIYSFDLRNDINEVLKIYSFNLGNDTLRESVRRKREYMLYTKYLCMNVPFSTTVIRSIDDK